MLEQLGLQQAIFRNFSHYERNIQQLHLDAQLLTQQHPTELTYSDISYQNTKRVADLLLIEMILVHRQHPEYQLYIVLGHAQSMPTRLIQSNLLYQSG